MNQRLPFPPSPHSFALAPRLLFLRHLLSALSREEYVCDLPASIGMNDLALRDRIQFIMNESSFGLIRHVIASFPVDIHHPGRSGSGLLQIVIRFSDGTLLFLQAMDLSKTAPSTHFRYLRAARKQEQGVMIPDGQDWPYPLFSAMGAMAPRPESGNSLRRFEGLISFRKSTR